MAIGIMIAWVLTITFIPAYVMFIKPKTLEKFGATHIEGQGAKLSSMGRFLQNMGGFTYRRTKIILALTCIIIAVAVYGISRINIKTRALIYYPRQFKGACE